jgi:hypothetical protein
LIGTRSFFKVKKTTKKKKAAKGGMKMEFGPKNAAKKGAVVKAKRGGPHPAKKKIVKKK